VTTSALRFGGFAEKEGLLVINPTFRFVLRQEPLLALAAIQLSLVEVNPNAFQLEMKKLLTTLAITVGLVWALVPCVAQGALENQARQDTVLLVFCDDDSTLGYTIALAVRGLKYLSNDSSRFRKGYDLREGVKKSLYRNDVGIVRNLISWYTGTPGRRKLGEKEAFLMDDILDEPGPKSLLQVKKPNDRSMIHELLYYGHVPDAPGGNPPVATPIHTGPLSNPDAPEADLHNLFPETNLQPLIKDPSIWTVTASGTRTREDYDPRKLLPIRFSDSLEIEFNAWDRETPQDRLKVIWEIIQQKTGAQSYHKIDSSYRKHLTLGFGGMGDTQVLLYVHDGGKPSEQITIRIFISPPPFSPPLSVHADSINETRQATLFSDTLSRISLVAAFDYRVTDDKTSDSSGRKWRVRFDPMYLDTDDKCPPETCTVGNAGRIAPMVSINPGEKRLGVFFVDNDVRTTTAFIPIKYQRHPPLMLLAGLESQVYTKEQSVDGDDRILSYGVILGLRTIVTNWLAFENCISLSTLSGTLATPEYSFFADFSVPLFGTFGVDLSCGLRQVGVVNSGSAWRPAAKFSFTIWQWETVAIGPDLGFYPGWGDLRPVLEMMMRMKYDLPRF
jgi:hypothetical protein